MKNKNDKVDPAQEEHERRRRTDALTAQKIDVAIIFQDMLGTLVAAQYLHENGISLSVALRVLVHARRKDPSPPKMIGIGDRSATLILASQARASAQSD